MNALERSVGYAGTALAAILSVTCPVVAQTAAASQPPDAVLESLSDQAMRMTVPVTIDGGGPYYFVVDTGSDRTVVSRELADRLGLAAGAVATMHSMTGVGEVSTVILGHLGVAGRTTDGINAPALAEYDLGAQGLLGIDSLKNRRIVMDFRARTLTIAQAGSREPIEPDMIVVTARSLYGQLVLVDADVDGTPVTVIIDSGAQNTIGNGALRRLLAKRRKSLEFFPTTLLDVTGGRLAADVASVGKVRLGGLTIDQIVIAFADAHPFKRFGLENRPAMLLGMDTLRAFRRVSVDFAARKVRFLLPGEA